MLVYHANEYPNSSQLMNANHKYECKIVSMSMKKSMQNHKYEFNVVVMSGTSYVLMRILFLFDIRPIFHKIFDLLSHFIIE